MNPNNQATDLVLLHQRVLIDLAQIFPSPWSLAWYVRQPDRLPIPLIGLELVAMPPAANQGNIGTEQIQLDLRFEAYVFTDFKTEDYRIKSRLYGGQLAAALVNRQWSGVANGPCRVLDSSEDRWRDNRGDQCDCWRVEWEQSCLFNVDNFAGGTIPTELYLGFPPNTGTGHEADYKRIV